VAADGLPISGDRLRAARHRLEELVKPDTRAFADVGETVAVHWASAVRTPTPNVSTLSTLSTQQCRTVMGLAP